MNEKNRVPFRHELKYLITSSQLRMIQARMNHVMELDKHACEEGAYTVRSLYFDDYDNRCFYENQIGIEPREKFRIRIYNHSTERITLECKRKERGKTLKTSCRLNMEQTRQLMEGKYLSDIGEQPRVLQKLTYQMMTKGMRPVVIVEYERIPYVCEDGNVRVTLDYDISSSKEVEQFLENNICVRPIMPIGQQLLEVKYDEFLPDYIYKSLQMENLRQTTYSKFYFCRKITL